LDPKAEAERRLAVANADQIYFNMGALTPEEIALSRFGERGWQDGYKIDRELREEVLEREAQLILEGEDPDTATAPAAPVGPAVLDEEGNPIETPPGKPAPGKPAPGKAADKPAPKSAKKPAP
jgi:hypothetical protein